MIKLLRFSLMRILFAFLLYTVHFIYILFIQVRLFWAHFSSVTPKPLLAPRRRIPKHLAVTFVIDPNIYSDTVKAALTESALKLVDWCQTIGIPKLTLYEEHDRLSECVQTLQERLSTPSAEAQNFQKLGKRQSHQKDVNTCRHALTLCLVSRQSAKPTIASVAHSLAQAQTKTKNRRPRKAKDSRAGATFQLSIDQFNQLLENEDGLSSPDFMIVQPINPDPSITAIELHGFPPWHIRLTEIYQKSMHSRPWAGPLDEFSFKEALDEFASAEMRLGK